MNDQIQSLLGQLTQALQPIKSTVDVATQTLMHISYREDSDGIDVQITPTNKKRKFSDLTDVAAAFDTGTDSGESADTHDSDKENNTAVKMCPHCGTIGYVHNVTDIFSKSNFTKDGYQSWCKQCRSKMHYDKRKATPPRGLPEPPSSVAQMKRSKCIEILAEQKGITIEDAVCKYNKHTTLQLFAQIDKRSPELISPSQLLNTQ